MEDRRTGVTSVAEMIEPTAALIDAALRVADALGAVRVAGASGDLSALESAMRNLGTANAALEIAARQYQGA